MELLLSEHPVLKSGFKYKAVKQLLPQLFEESDCANIATGFVSNASIVYLMDIIDKRSQKGHKMTLNLFIGMDYIEHFTRLQYNALVELNKMLEKDKMGYVMVSKDLLYHGKMYAFERGGICDNAFVGSSNLGSFLGTSDEMIEADVFFHGKEASAVNLRIKEIQRTIGTRFSDLPIITDFKQPAFTLLDDNTKVRKRTKEEMEQLAHFTDSNSTVEIPLKATPKSNLNTYFGAGKVKNRWSPRDWYEVEIIVSEKYKDRQLLENAGFPTKGEKFTVITSDGYEFLCELQGGNVGKNLRSVGDLRILGKWIKGHLEYDGALELGKPVTSDVLKKAEKSKLVFSKLTTGEWYLTME